MKLYSKKVFFTQYTGEGNTMISYPDDCLITYWCRIEAVDKIELTLWGNTAKNWVHPFEPYLVPAHMRHLEVFAII